MRSPLWVLLLLLPACRRIDSGSTALREIAPLEGAARFEILALDPYHVDYRGVSADAVEHVHGYQVRARALVADRGTRRSILSLVRSGIRDAGISSLGCFNPRHAVRAEHDGSTTELLLCYECFTFQLYRDGRHLLRGTTSDRAAARIDAIWRAHGCQPAPGPSDSSAR